MSATAFQRMRRIAEAKKKEAPVTQTELSNKQIKTLLDEKGIKYNPKAKKEELIALLEANMVEEIKQGEPDNSITPESDDKVSDDTNTESDTTNNDKGAE
jgi:hypothetical protein